jgi:hypothetical protein
MQEIINNLYALFNNKYYKGYIIQNWKINGVVE